MWRDHFGKADDGILVIHGATRAFNETFPQETVDRELAKDRAKAGAEYLAEWRDDLVGLFDREALQACTDTGVYERPPVAGVDYVAFLDPASGRGNSSMVLAIAHSEGDRVVVDCIREAKPPFSAAERLVEMCRVARSYGCTTIFKDRWGVEFSDELIRQAGLRCEVSPLPKNDLLLGLVPRVSSNLVRFIDSGRFIDQATSLERRVGITGRESIVVPDKTADDIVNAVAGAVHVASLVSAPALIKPSNFLGRGGKAVPDPVGWPFLFVVLNAGDDGETAAAFFALSDVRRPLPHLVLVDLDVAPLSATTVVDAWKRLQELQRDLRAGMSFGWVHPSFVPQVERHGFVGEVIPANILADEHLAMSVAGQVASGAVKLSERAHGKMAQLPLGASLTFRSGEAVNRDPLRFAIATAIAAGLNPEGGWG
jgi:hypothetical protein